MFEIFIRRPILSGVISVVIVFLGLLAINSLPITQFPDIVPPSVTVTARYTGANADVMAKTVATPLERAINGVPGMTYMTSVCTNDGMSLTTIYFKVGTDLEIDRSQGHTVVRTNRGHIGHSGHAVDSTLQRGRHRFRHHVGVRSGITGGNGNGWGHDIRELGDRQGVDRQQSQEDNYHRYHAR